MIHNRACPTCGFIVQWTRGKQVTHKMYSGEVTAYEMHLICPEHGEFEPRAHEKLNTQLTRVMKKVGDE